MRSASMSLSWSVCFRCKRSVKNKRNREFSSFLKLLTPPNITLWSQSSISFDGMEDRS
ncbi:hypothetical protein Ancab_026871 [Ancistrocladus abbreviatus]